MRQTTSAVVCLLVVGCGMGNVTIKPSPVIRVEKAYDISVALLFDGLTSTQVHSVRGVNFRTGEGLVIGAKKTFGRLFSDVTVIRSVAAFDREACRLLIEPRVLRFIYIKGLGDEVYEVDIGCRITDADGKTVYDGRATGSARHGLLDSPTSSYMDFGYYPTMAFNNAFAALAADILARVDLSAYVRD